MGGRTAYTALAADELSPGLPVAAPFEPSLSHPATPTLRLMIPCTYLMTRTATYNISCDDVLQNIDS